jgi:hypothetical protein
VNTFSTTLQVHVFVGGVEEKLMANKAIKQAVEVMMNPGGKMSRVQEILRRAHISIVSRQPLLLAANLFVPAQRSRLSFGLIMNTETCIRLCEPESLTGSEPGHQSVTGAMQTTFVFLFAGHSRAAPASSSSAPPSACATSWRGT